MIHIDPCTWGNASVMYPDWKGTIQIDEKLTGEHSIYDLTNIDREKWRIVGLEWGSSEEGPHELVVIAVPFATDLGGEAPLEAARIMIHDSDPFAIIQQITHLADFRLRLGWVEDSHRAVTITQLGDEPEQD